MKIACTYLSNTGIAISKNLVSKTIFKYTGLLQRGIFKLYDLGYLDSPAIFDIDMFRRVLFDEFKTEAHLLRSHLDGKIAIDDTYIVNYALMQTEDKDFKEVLSIYKDILRATKALDAYNTLVTKVRLPKKSDKVILKTRLGVSGGVRNYSIVPLDEPSLSECFVLEPDEKLVSINTSSLLIKALTEDLGVSSEGYLSWLKSGQAFFVSNLSFNDELEILPCILQGKIKADGKYGGLLMNRITAYYSEFYTAHKSTMSCNNYEEYIFNQCLEDRIDIINAKRKSFGETPYREFYATDSEVIFAVKDSSDTGKVLNYFKDNTVHLGTVAFCHDTRAEFSKINTLQGLCGEFVNKKTVEENGYLVKGAPVGIKFGIFVGEEFRLSELSYYPIHNVYYNVNGTYGANVSPLLGNSLHITVSDINSVLSEANADTKDKLYRSVFHNLTLDVTPKGVSVTNYKHLVADLVVALIYAECGEIDYSMCHNDYSWVDDNIFYQASTVAEEIFNTYSYLFS